MFPTAGLGQLGRPIMTFLGAATLGQDKVVAQQEVFTPSATAASDRVVAQMMQTPSSAQTPDNVAAQQDSRTLVGRTTCICAECPKPKRWPLFIAIFGGLAAGVGIGAAAFGSRTR